MNTNNIEINTQSSIRINMGKILYFDPFKINDKKCDADIILITHDHYDHFDIDSINNIKNDNTIIIAPNSIKDKFDNIKCNNYIFLNPNEEINIDNINIKTILSYNNQKQFHPREKNYLGYIVTYNNITYYIAGDTDNTKEAQNVKCDIALIPIGGYYTMDINDASNLLRVINPKVVIPTHYGSIIGNTNDGEKLKELLSDTKIEVVEKLHF